MRLRKIVASFALALASCATYAAAPYDGIYQVTTGEWITVLEKNGYVVAAYYFSNASNGALVYNLNNGQHYVPPRLDNWDLLSGPLSNGVATLTGESVFGACKVTMQLNFNLPALRFTFITPTPSGQAQGVNCLSVGDWLIFNHGNVNQWPLSKIW